MKLSHIRIEERGFVLHAWATPAGVCATMIGERLPEGAQPGARPVAGVEIVAEDDGVLGALAASLRVYFRGESLQWDGPFDLRGTTEFQREVLQAVRAIPYGDVRRYRDVAATIGRPHSVRAVGDALGRNPLPVVVPCHRVVAARGLGGYAAGAAVKQRLLRLESGQTALDWPEGSGP